MDSTTATTVGIIPCGAEKADGPAEARDLYVGAMFRHTLAAALAAFDVVLVLSARYGLVTLDTVLAPYDLRVGQAGSVSPAVVAAQAVTLGLDADVDVYTMLPAAYQQVADQALRSLDVYASDAYEAAPGIGYQRGVNRHARLPLGA